jgi:hypothetical protein
MKKQLIIRFYNIFRNNFVIQNIELVLGHGWYKI